MTTPTNEPMTVEQILETFRRVVWNSGWNSPSDEALAQATTQINALIAKRELDGLNALGDGAWGHPIRDEIEKRKAELQQLLQKGENDE